jgi:hypothetical protein
MLYQSIRSEDSVRTGSDAAEGRGRRRIWFRRPIAGRNGYRNLIRRRTAPFIGGDRSYHVIVKSTVLYQVVHAACAADRNRIDLLACSAGGVVFGCTLRLASIQAISHSVVLGTGRGNTGDPGENNPMMSGRGRRLKGGTTGSGAERCRGRSCHYDFGLTRLERFQTDA